MFLADTIEGLFWIGLLLSVYFLPTIVAFNRHVPSPWSVAVINTLLGWTLIGWAVALAMSARDPRTQKEGHPSP